MNLVCMILTGLLLVPQGDGKPPLSAAVKEKIRILKTGSEEAKRGAIRDLLKPRDEAVIPHLLALLDEDDRETRVLVTMGLIATFPDKSAALFLPLLEGKSLNVREAASYAIGFVEDPRVPGTVIRLLESPEERIRTGAASAFVNRARPALNAAQTRINGGVVPFDEARLGALRQLRLGLVERMVADAPPLGPEANRLIQRFGNHETAAALLERFRRDCGEAGKELGDLIGRMFQVNRRWLGQAQIPRFQRLEYRFEMENLVAGSTKEFEVNADRRDLETIRARGYYLDRGIHLELPLDSFLSHPRACSPVLLPAAAGAENTGRARIRYRVPEKKMLVVGIGALTISYWQCKVLRPTWGTVTIDKARGVPIEEELIDASEKTVARIEYQEYLAAGDGALAPSRIRVEVFDGLVGSKQRHMIYEARFRLADGVWILDGAEGSEVTEKGPERRALASVQAVRVVRAEKPTSRPRKE